MGEYKDFQIPEKEELLLGEFDDNQIRESKMKKVTNWERNGVFEKVKNTGQKAINTKWITTKKVTERRVVYKVRLVARGLKLLKLCVAKIIRYEDGISTGR